MNVGKVTDDSMQSAMYSARKQHVEDAVMEVAEEEDDYDYDSEKPDWIVRPTVMVGDSETQTVPEGHCIRCEQVHIDWDADEEAVRKFTTVRPIPHGVLRRNIARWAYHKANKEVFPDDEDWKTIECTRLVFAHK